MGEEVTDLFMSLKAEILKRVPETEAEFSQWRILSYKTQVVAGLNYFIKFTNTKGECGIVEIHKPATGKAQLKDVREDKCKSSAKVHVKVAKKTEKVEKSAPVHVKVAKKQLLGGESTEKKPTEEVTDLFMSLKAEILKRVPETEAEFSQWRILSYKTQVVA